MNILRDIVPSAYAVLEQLVSDPIRYKRGSAAFVDTTATPLPADPTEPVQGGNVLRFFMSQSQVGLTPPASGDSVEKDGATYRVTNVQSNDYDGYFLTLRKT